MTKQHTFKSTRTTSWIDEILDAQGDNKSAFIRHLIISGLMNMGVHPPIAFGKYNHDVVNFQVLQMPVKSNTNVTQTSHESVTSDSDTSVPSTSHESVTSAIHIRTGVDDEPEIFSKEVSLPDLEAKLDSLDFE